MTKWAPAPGLGGIFAKIVELHARIKRIEAKQRADRLEKTLKILAKVPPK